MTKVIITKSAVEASSLHSGVALTSRSQSLKVQKVEQQRLKEEKQIVEYMHDVLLLLNNLFEREEATVKIVLDCLYEVGSINLVNQKVSNFTLNRLVKSIAKFSKPVFRLVAIRWFKKNVPTLLTNWLRLQVSFKPLETKVVTEIPANEINTLPEVKIDSEVQKLRSQVRVLTGFLVATIALSVIVTFG
jgi:hypothetical protein